MMPPLKKSILTRIFIYTILPLSLLTNSFAQDIPDLQKKLSQTSGAARLSSLHELTSIYRDISLDSSKWYAHQAIRLAQTMNNDSLLADARLRLCPSLNFAGLSDSVIIHATIAREIGEKLSSLEIEAYALQLLATAVGRKADFDKAIEYNQQSLALYTELNDLKGMGAIRQNIAGDYTKTGQLTLALENALEAEQIAEQTQRAVSQGLTALTIANIYGRLEKTDKQVAYLQKAKAIFTRDSFPRKHAIVLNQMANQHFVHQQLDSSIYYFLQSLAISESLGDSLSIATAHGNLGSIYQEAQQWQQSFFHLHKGLAMKRQLNNTYGVVYDLFNLGGHYYLQNKRDSAAYYYQQSLQMSTENDVTRIREASLELLVDFYEEGGEYELALDYQKQYQAFKEETKGVAVEKKIASLEAQYENEKKEREIERLELTAVAQTEKNKALSIGLLSILLLAGLIITGILYRRRNERQLSSLQQALHEEEKQKLDQELGYKNKQLTSHALHMVKKNEVLQEIKQEIATLSSTANAKNKKALDALVRRIDFDIQSDEDWNTFKLYFEQTNQDFYINLSKINENLTTTELKLCSLIKLNMNIKETASVLNIEPNSVKTARHRLRKKLNLEQGQDLTSFIRQVA